MRMFFLSSAMILLILALPLLAQQPSQRQSCERQLAVSNQRVLTVMDSRQYAEGQLAEIRQVNVEQRREIATLQAQLKKAQESQAATVQEKSVGVGEK